MKTNNNKNDFLLTFFEKDEYSEKELNGFWLIKKWNGQTNRWEVAIYTKDGYENYKRGGEKWKEIQSQEQHLFDISREA